MPRVAVRKETLALKGRDSKERHNLCADKGISPRWGFMFLWTPQPRADAPWAIESRPFGASPSTSSTCIAWPPWLDSSVFNRLLAGLHSMQLLGELSTNRGVRRVRLGVLSNDLRVDKNAATLVARKGLRDLHQDRAAGSRQVVRPA